MKERIKAKLNRISDLDERTVLKNVLSDIFLEIYNLSNESFRILEKRVYSEVVIQNPYNIYGTVVPRDEVDLSSDFFFPILPDKLDPPIYDFNEIKRAVMQKEPYFLFDVFFNCNYDEFFKLVSSDREFNGVINTDYRDYRVTFEIEQNFEYINIIENLYKLFSANAISWKTVNFPYLWRFVDVYIVSCEPMDGGEDDSFLEMASDENITGMSVDFEEYKDFAQYSMIPLWNLAHYDYTLKSVPIPVGDIVNYEHIIDINDIDNPGGILIDFQNMEIPNIRRSMDKIYVTLNNKKANWSIYNLVPNYNNKFDEYEKETFSNEKKINFTQSYVNTKSQNVKTKAELIRLINSFGLDKYIVFVDVSIVDYDVENSGIYLNYFIEDEIRDMSSKKNMLIFFQAVDLEHNYNKDIMNFVVSELQEYFPEYICVGEII